MTRARAEDYDFIKDAEMRELLFGEGGPLDASPPVLPMLKKWTGSPRFHLDQSQPCKNGGRYVSADGSCLRCGADQGVVCPIKAPTP